MVSTPLMQYQKQRSNALYISGLSKRQKKYHWKEFLGSVRTQNVWTAKHLSASHQPDDTPSFSIPQGQLRSTLPYCSICSHTGILPSNPAFCTHLGMFSHSPKWKYAGLVPSSPTPQHPIPIRSHIESAKLSIKPIPLSYYHSSALSLHIAFTPL